MTRTGQGLLVGRILVVLTTDVTDEREINLRRGRIEKGKQSGTCKLSNK